MDVCEFCGAAISEGAAFCSSCGARVESKASRLFCVSCGSELQPDAAFCPNCGTPRSGASSPRSPYEIGVTDQKRVSDCLVWSIISTIVFFPIGLGALVLSLLSRNAAGQGNMKSAASYAEGARIWNVVVLILGLAGFIFMFGGFLFMMIFGFAVGV